MFRSPRLNGKHQLTPDSLLPTVWLDKNLLSPRYVSRCVETGVSEGQRVPDNTVPGISDDQKHVIWLKN